MRRLMNQAFFKAIYVDDDEHVRTELAAPFDVLFTRIQSPRRSTSTNALARQWWRAVTAAQTKECPQGTNSHGHPHRPTQEVVCLKHLVLVGRGGIEPPTLGLKVPCSTD